MLGFYRTIVFSSVYLMSAAIGFSQRSDLLPITYEYAKSGDSITKVYPVSGYLEMAKRGGPIDAFPWRPCCEGFFAWSFPKLSVKSINSTRQAAYFSEIVFNVSRSERNDEPVLLLEEDFEGRVYLINEGWGTVIEPVLQFDMTISGGGYSLDSGWHNL
jgi:hypothetical protein